MDGEPVQSLQAALQALGCNSCMELAAGVALDRAEPAKIAVPSFLVVFFSEADLHSVMQ